MQHPLLDHELSSENLQDSAFSSKFDAGVAELAFNCDIEDAFQLSVRLSDALRVTGGLNKQMQDSWHSRLLRLRIIAFGLLTIQEQGGILRDHSDAFLENYSDEPLAPFRLLGSTQYFFQGDPEWRQMLDALHASPVAIGQEPINLSGKQLPPAIKNWLVDYNTSKPESDRPRGKIEQLEYVSQNPNVQHLPQEDRDKLRKLLAIEDWLRHPGESSQLAVGAGIAKIPPAAPRVGKYAPPGPTPFSPRPTTRPMESLTQPRAPRPGASRGNIFASRPSNAAMPVEPASGLREIGSAPLSLSFALGYAGRVGGGSEQGQIRIGKTTAQGVPASGAGPGLGDTSSPVRPRMPGSAQTQQFAPVGATRPPQPLVAPTVRPQAPPTVRPPTPPASPPKPQDQIASLLKNYPLPQASVPQGGIVDLSKRPPMDFSRITQIADLQKISLSDLSSGFDQGLTSIKALVSNLAVQNKLPVKQVLNFFYRSPLYNLYVAMAVAVMNDAASDQTTAFEKVQKNYQAAKKEFLTREQFLSLNRFKKELAQLS